MLRPALILLTLFLASCVSASAQEKQAPREGVGEIQQEDARPALLLPKTFVCVFPGGPHTKAHEQRQPVPPGKQLKDLCPHGAKTYLDYGHAPLRLRMMEKQSPAENQSPRNNPSPPPQPPAPGTTTATGTTARHP